MSDSVSISLDHRVIAPLAQSNVVQVFDSETLEFDFEIDQSGGILGWVLCGTILSSFRNHSGWFREGVTMIKGIKPIRELGMCRSSVCVGRGIGRGI
jgi:hypothetical protein